MYLKRKIMLTLIITIILACVIGFSYAKFVPVQTAGNRNINTIMGNTLSATNNNPNIVVTYDESTPYIDTGDLVLTTDPLNEIIKFKVSTISTSDVYVETSLTTAKNTLTTAGTYNLYECSETNYNQATYANVSTNCTSIGKTTGNSLPAESVKVFIHQERSITVPAGGTKHLVFTYSIAASNNTKRYIGLLNTNLKDMTWFDFTYTGDYIDSRVDGIGPVYFTSTGTLTVTNGKTDVNVDVIGAGGGGGGAGGNFTYTYPNCSSTQSRGGGYGGGGGSGYYSSQMVDVVNGSYDFVIGTGGGIGIKGNGAYHSDCDEDEGSQVGTSGTSGTSGGQTIALGITSNGGRYGGGGTPGYYTGGVNSRGEAGSNGSAGTGGNNASGYIGGVAYKNYGGGGNGGYNYTAATIGQNGAVILTFN